MGIEYQAGDLEKFFGIDPGFTNYEIERERLKEAVVEAVRREDRKGMLTPWIQEAREALIEFEQKQ